MNYVKLLVFVAVIISGCDQANATKKKTNKKGNPEFFKACEAEVCIKTHGRAGKIVITRKAKGEDDPQKMVILVSSVKERNKEGRAIVLKGAKQKQHSFNKFAGLEFNIGEVKNDATYQGIKAIHFNLSASIPGPKARLNIPMYIFKENGTLDVCDEQNIEVHPGSLKYNIELYNWKFCHPCTSREGKPETGAFVDLALTVRKKGEAIRLRNQFRSKGRGKKGGKRTPLEKAPKFFFGKSSISFPHFYKVDDNCTEMEGGYPSLRTKIKRTEFQTTLRFHKFKNYADYDPVLLFEDPESEGGHEEGGGHGGGNEGGPFVEGGGSVSTTVKPAATTEGVAASTESSITGKTTPKSSQQGPNGADIGGVDGCNSCSHELISFYSIAIAFLVAYLVNLH